MRALSATLLCLLTLLVAVGANAQAIITTVAGTSWGFSGGGGPATKAPLGRVQGIVTDAEGNVYVADADNHLIVRISPSDAINVIAGNGTKGYAGDGGPATMASLSFPTAVARDNAGNLYIADSLNARIRKVSPSGVISTFAGTGDYSYYGDGSPAVRAAFNFPSGLALDKSGRLYVADAFNNRIRRIDTNGTVTTIAGTGESGFSGDGGPATAARLDIRSGLHVGLAIDSSGDLYIADTNNNLVRKISSGGIITSVSPGPLGPFSGPSDLAFNRFDELLIADAFSCRILKITPYRGILTPFGNISKVAGGSFGFSGDGGSAIYAGLKQPFGVAVDLDGNVFIADTFNKRVRKVDLRTAISTIAGNGLFKLTGDGGPATKAAMNGPSGLAIDSERNIYASTNSGNNLIRKVIAGSAITGGTLVTLPAGELIDPAGLAADSSGSLYIADSYNHRIRKVAPDGAITTVAGIGLPGFDSDGGPATGRSLNLPLGVALDAVGNLYIADSANNRVRKVDTKGTITTVAGNGVARLSGDGGPATQASLNQPAGITVDAGGALYISDSGNNVVRKVTSDGKITTIAGGGSFSPGDGGPATYAILRWPTGIAVDSSGSVFVVDTYNHRVRKIDRNGIISTFAGTGTPGYGGDGGAATKAQLNFRWGLAAGLALDSAGSLYIADSDNDRIRVVQLVPPVLSANVTELKLSALSGGPPPASVEIVLASTVAWEARIPTEADWLAVSPSTGQAPASVRVSVNPGKLLPGNYTADLMFRALGPSSAETSIQVSLTVLPNVLAGGLVNAAGFAAQPLAPGSLATIFGINLSSSEGGASSNPLPWSLNGIRVSVNGFPAPLSFTSGTQINFQVPWELAGLSRAALTVVANGVASSAQQVNLQPFGPGIFSTGSGSSQGAVLAANSNTVADAAHPVKRGDSVSIFCTGLGPVSNAPATGSPALSSPLSTTLTAPTVTIGGANAQVTFSGLAPGFVGLYQVNAQVPAEAAPGNAVPVSISIGGVSSNTVTIAVQ